MIVLGVTGGIAAYKAASLLRLLTESGHDVTVVPTESALRFVGEPTWAALSGRPIATGVWDDVHEVPHVRSGQAADLVVVAPATADLLARAAHGLADDLLTNALLTARCPVLMAPAMHTEMWEHPATQANVALLRERGVIVLDPAVGRLTGADTGRGRLPEPEEIFARRPSAARRPRRAPSATWPDDAWSSPLGGPASTSTRCVSSATAHPASRGTRSRAPPSPAGPRCAWSRPTSRCPTRPGSRWSASSRRPTCATPSSRPPRTPTRWSWRPRWPTSDPLTGPSRRSRRQPTAGFPIRWRSSATADVLTDLVARPSPRAGGRRLRRRDRRRRR